MVVVVVEWVTMTITSGGEQLVPPTPLALAGALAGPPQRGGLGSGQGRGAGGRRLLVGGREGVATAMIRRGEGDELLRGEDGVRAGRWPLGVT